MVAISAQALAIDPVDSPKKENATKDKFKGEGKDEFHQVDTANFEYVGGKTRVGVGVDTEFDGTADLSHIISESKDAATSGDGWIGFDIGGSNKGVDEGGVKLNHHWVDRDEQGRALRVNKVFGAYDRSTNKHDKVTIGYGQEVDIGFWEAYVGRGLSNKRSVGLNQAGQELFEKSYKHNVGGHIGKFLPDSSIRVRGGLDYAWDNERGIGESKPTQVALSAGAEKFFQGTPHSVSLDVEARRKKGGNDKSNTDTRANLSYRYDFGAEDTIYQGGQKFRRVRVELPSQEVSALQPQAVAAVKKMPYKKAVSVNSCDFVKSTVELGSDTFFKYDSAKLRSSAKKRLKSVVAKIRHSGYVGNIRITGNTCDIGTDTHNQKLSTRRANVVRRYMASKGFEGAELIARGLGETKPKYPNQKTTRHKNRRVDIEYVTQNGQCKARSKTVYKTEYKADPVALAATPQKSATKPGVTWRTELIPSEPTWVKRALHHNIRHNRRVDTFRTTAGNTLGTAVVGQIQVVNDTATTRVNTPVTVDVLGNDVGTVLQVTNTGQAANGTVAIVNSAVVYTPATDFIGTDQFTYTVRDSNDSQGQGTVTVTVQAGDIVANVAPVLQDDSVGTTINQPISIDVLANDIDPDGDTLVITSIEQPTNGTAEVVNSEILYTPNQGFSGTDTVRYTITDGNGHIASAVATITVVSNANTVLVVQDDVVTTPVNQPVTIDVIANDTAPDGGVVRITGITQPTQGTAVINNDQVVYTPVRDFSGTDTLTYTVSDGSNQVRSGTVTIRVIGTANTAPVVQDDSATTVANQPVTINVIGNDTDPDGDSLTIRSVTQPTNGNVSISNNQLVYTPNQDFVGTDTLTYTITDGNNHVQTASVIVTIDAADSAVVIGTNTSPVAQDDSVVTTTNQPVTINVISNDSDADGDTLSIQTVTQPTNGSVSIDNGQLVYTPNQGFTGTDSLTYTINDGNNHQETANVTIDVSAGTNTSGNSAPIIADDSVTTNINQPVTIDVLTNDNDPDGDNLSVTAITQPANGSATISGGQIVYTPNDDFTGTDTLDYTIDDGNNNQRTARVTIIINDTSTAGTSNTAPTAQDDQQSASGNSITIDVLRNDMDADGDTLSITTVDNPSHGSTNIVHGYIVYTPETQYTGDDSFGYTITDGQNTSTATVRIRGSSDGATGAVGATENQAPDVNDDFLGNMPANADILVYPLNNDSDADGDTLSIIALGSSSYGSARDNGDGTVSFTPVRDYCGPITFSYTVSDGHGNTGRGTVHITTE
jgi:outer membrane protein OmpA-like peptidoglycan-associated protein